MGVEQNGSVAADVRWVAYGAPAYDELRRVVAAAKTEDALAPVTLVVASNLAGTIARRTLARMRRPGGGTGVAALTVLTVDRLAELVGAPALVARGRRPATAPVPAAAWRRELAEDARSFGPVAEHPATVRALVDAYRALRDVSPEARGAVASTGQLPEDVVTLFERAATRLETGWYDVHDLCETAVAELGQAATAVARQLGTVVFFLPQDLDRSRGAVGRALCGLTGGTVIAGLSGDARSDAGVIRTVGRLVGTAVDAPVASPPTATRVLHASDSDDETRCVVRDVVDALRETPADRIAVLYGSASPYARLLHEHLAAAGITINGPGVRPTAERLLPRAFLEILALAETGLTRARVFGLLSGAPVRGADGRPVPVARWERISRIAGVVTAADWDARLGRYRDEQRARAAAERANPEEVRDWLVERHERDAEAAVALGRFVRHLQGLLDLGTAASDWATLTTWALTTFRTLLGTEDQHRRLPDEEREAGVRLERIVAGLAGLGTLEEHADLVALRQVVELELADDLPRAGTSGTGVLVAPLSAAVGLDLDRIFVVGLAEGLCPARQSEDALLPDHAREATVGELPALRERLDVQRRQLLAAFAAAPEVHASFPRGDLRRSGDRLPSRWLLPTLRARTGTPTLTLTDWAAGAPGAAVVASPSYATTVLAADPATEQEWRQQALHAPASTQAVAEARADAPLARATELLRGRHSAAFTRFDGNLTAYREGLPDPADGVRIVSPTALESWAACPHGYFVERLLRVEPVEHPEELLEMSPLERGSLLHTALERFFAWLQTTGGAPGPEAAWTEAQRLRLRAFGAEVADEFEARGVTGHPTMWARDRVQVLRDLARVLDIDEQIRASEGRRQLHSELRFGRGAGRVEVPLPDGRTLRFSGSADRVDVTDDGTLVVVDYKSGSTSRFQGLSEGDPTMGGTKLQLPVYAHAARQALDRPDAPVRAEYWFIGPKGGGARIRLPLTPDVSREHAEALQVVADGIHGGLYPANAPEDQPWLPYIPCAYCDPDGLGAKDRRLQWARKRSAPELRSYLGLVDPDPVAEAGEPTEAQ